MLMCAYVYIYIAVLETAFDEEYICLLETAFDEEYICLLFPISIRIRKSIKGPTPIYFLLLLGLGKL